MRLVRCAWILVFLFASCTFDVSFREDDRVTIVAPKDRATVTQPVTMQWEVTEFEITGPGSPSGSDRGFFAVFVDRNPIAPGKSLDSVASDDSSCRRTPGCPDEAYLNNHGVFTTTDTAIVLPPLVDTRPRGRAGVSDWHGRDDRSHRSNGSADR